MFQCKQRLHNFDSLIYNKSVWNQKIYEEAVLFGDKLSFMLTSELGRVDWDENKLLFSAAAHLRRATQSSLGTYLVWVLKKSVRVFARKQCVSGTMHYK